MMMMVVVFVVQMDVLKRKVDRTASDLESVRAQIKQMKNDIIRKQLRSTNLFQQSLLQS